LYMHQREVLTELADVLVSQGAASLDHAFADDFRKAPDEVARRRVIVDQVASLTDQSALAWHERLVVR
jgi:dGTPase